MQTNSVNHSHPLFYVDGNKEVQVDNKRGHFSCIGKVISSKLGYRNYNILEVLKAAVSSTKSLKDYEVNLICEKAGKKLHLNAQVMTKLFKVLQLAQQGQSYETEMHALTKECSDSKKLKGLQELKSVFEKTSPTGKALFSVIDEATVRSKWGALSLDAGLVDRHFQDVQFLVQTRVIYSIIGMQNTTASGKVKHEIKEIADPTSGKTELCIKKEGKWVPVRQIRQELVWDSKETALASQSNPNERWNYFDDGLVPIDRFYHHEVAREKDYPVQNAKLHPVAKLSQEEVEDLLTRAKTFKGFDAKNNPNQTGEKLTCVVQFVSHPRPMSDNPLLQNLNAQVPVHCGIRLVMSDGSVYSTGFGSTLQEDTYNEGLNKYLGTINGQPTILDYEEFRPHEGRIVTNIPLGDGRAEAILEKLNAYREGSIRFNILKQNCMRLGTNVMAMAGVDLNIRQTFGEMLYRALPNLEDIAVVGKPLKSLHGRVKQVSNAVSSKIPNVVKAPFRLLSKIVFFIPERIATVMVNLLVLAMGGVVASPVRQNPLLASQDSPSPSPKNLEELESLNTFPKLLNGLFDETASDIQHSAIVINWQLQQESTDVHRYSGQPSMNILPPKSDDEHQYSAKRKEEFQKIYQHAVPQFMRRKTGNKATVALPSSKANAAAAAA